VDYPAGSVVDYSGSTYLAVQTNGPSTTAVTPGSNPAYWVATTGNNSLTPASYIDVTSLAVGGSIAPGQQLFAGLPLTTAATNSGFGFNPITGAVTVLAAGTYTYDYNVSVISAGALGLTLNGNLLVGTSFGRATGTTQIIGHGVITLNVGDVVGLTSALGTASLSSFAPDETTAAFSLVAMAAGTPGATGATGATGPAGTPGLNGINGLNGIPGPQGATGASGAPGTTGATGPPVMFKGNYVAGTAYAVGDAVFCTTCTTNGSSYVALKANLNIDPPTDVSGSGGNWALLAQQGATGPPGTPGPTGLTGATGATGTPGLNGATGATGAGSVTSVSVSVTNGNATGSASISNATTTPALTINFPASSGFVWTTSFPGPTDSGPDNVNPLTGAIGLVPASGVTQTPEFAFAPVACTASSLQVYTAAEEFAFGFVIVTVKDNGINTSMSCGVGFPPPPPGLPFSCSSTSSFIVNAGDEIQYSIETPGGQPGSLTQIGATLTCQ
jgi:hypothetical protein